MLNVSSISGSATSAELSSLTYDHLFRTVPSDTFLAKAMVDLVTHFNWSYVAVVGLDDSYGKNGAWALVSESTWRKSSFCIALTEFIRLESLNLSIRNIVKKLKQMENVKVVILWLYEKLPNEVFRRGSEAKPNWTCVDFERGSFNFYTATKRYSRELFRISVA